MFNAIMIAFQAATGTPDISLYATVEARQVKIQKRGNATIRAWAEPDGGSKSTSSGNSNTRHFELQLDARLADPAVRQQQATVPVEPR